VAIELLAEWRARRSASKHGRHRRQPERRRHERRSQTRASSPSKPLVTGRAIG
jgi:hypothetical protein